MSKIEIYLLGTPRVYINGERYLFPYRRAEALFYYLVTRGSENKNVLEDMFWGDIFDENRANRNYRNAVYRIRKDFGHDFFIRDGRQNLALNPEADVWTDIHAFKKDLALLEQADSLCFLWHFEVEHCVQFDTYVTHKQQEYAEEIYELLLHSYKTGDIAIMESICRKLIDMDELCEKYYSLLLLIYGEMNNLEMAENVYQALQKLLMEELGVKPGEQVTKTMISLRNAPVKVKTAESVKEKDFTQRSVMLLEWVCLFLDPVSYECLEHFTGIDEEEFAESIERFVRKSQIREEELDGKIYYSISGSKLGENIYQKISLTRRRRMHRMAANWLEERFQSSSVEELLPKLIYHFMRGGCPDKADDYLKRYFSSYIAISHEFFPVIRDYPLSYHVDTYMKNIRQFTYIMQQLEQYVGDYGESVNPESFDLARIALYSQMLLQAAVKKADYNKSWEYIRILEAYDGEIERVSRQKAYIYINTYRAEELFSLAEEMLVLCRDWEREYVGFWMRIKGMSLILMGQMEDGRRCLFNAVDIFMDKGNEGLLEMNAVVSYSWIGDSYRLERDYENAVRYLLRSQKLTSKVHDISGKTLIYTRIGQYYMDTGNTKEAGKYIRAAIKNYEWLGVIWKRSTAYGCAALLYAEKGQWNEAADSLEKQGYFAALVEEPYEQAFYYRVLELFINCSRCPGSVRRGLLKISQSLVPPLADGCDGLIRLLPSPYEREYLRNLKLCNN